LKKIAKKRSFPVGKHAFQNIYFFGHLCPKSAAIGLPNHSANNLFSTAGFVLFCRIYGRLATVHGRAASLTNSGSNPVMPTDLEEFSAISTKKFSRWRKSLAPHNMD
jgi:hypothetical protein